MNNDIKFETIRKPIRKKIIIGSLVTVAVVSAITLTTSRAKFRLTQSIPVVRGFIKYDQSDLNIVSIKLIENGVETDTDEVPTSGYKLNTTKSVCNVSKDGVQTKDENITINYHDGKIAIDNVSKKKTKCYLYFDKSSSASDKLIATGELVQENGYRYEGSNPNNYVTFNNELWRIIGVFDTTVVDEVTEEQKQEQLIKIIRDEKIGNIAWDSNNVNDWTTASLKTLLNEGDYYNRSGDYSSNGLTAEAKKMIENVVWHLGGHSTNVATADTFYSAERGSTGASGTTDTAKIKWTGKVGLMYPSDYGYAAPASSCTRTTALYDYDSSGCYDNNWLYKNSYDQWTITPRSSYAYDAFYVSNGGYLSSRYANYGCGGSPSVYLKSGTKIVSGQGSYDSPYILS